MNTSGDRVLVKGCYFDTGTVPNKLHLEHNTQRTLFSSHNLIFFLIIVVLIQ